MAYNGIMREYMFSNPNQVHHYEIEAQFTHYAESVNMSNFYYG